MKKILSALSAALLIAVGLPAAEATEFKPGEVGFGVNLPADTKFGNTNELHPCAGRKLAYHSHIDAIYATRYNDELTTMIVDGQVPTPADQLCLRLAPDGKPTGSEAGLEVSRMVVPFDDPTLQFLGEPGTILWVAPQAIPYEDSWHPIWAGAGAFDNHHEITVPTDFKDNSIQMELADEEQPGDVEMFFYNRSATEADRVFSTKEKKLTFPLEVGSHGHYSWTFSKAGIYHLKWRVSGEKKDGTTETSDWVTTTWLVGSDEEVGLPAGTTTNLGEITKSAEDVRDEMIAAAKPTSTTEPSAPSGPTGTQSKEQVQELLWHSNPTDLITHGHQDMGLHGSGQNATAKMTSDVDGDHLSTSFVYAVPNSALMQIPPKVSKDIGGVCAGWVLPQAQDPNLPWQGFSTENFDYNSVDKDGITVSISKFEGPGRMITSHDSLRSTTVSLDSEDPSLKLRYPQRSHDHMTFIFTQPGAYRVTYTFSGKTKEGKPIEENLVAYYMVGDSALFDAATQMGLDVGELGYTEPATRDTIPECAPVTEAPAPSTETKPTTPATSTAPSTTSPTTTGTPSPTPGKPDRPNDSGKKQSGFGPQELGLAIGAGFAALKITNELIHRDDSGSKKSADAKQPKAIAAPVAPAGSPTQRKDSGSEPKSEAKPEAKAAPAAAGSGNAGGSVASANKSGGTASAKTSAKSTTTAKPTATKAPATARTASSGSQEAAPAPVVASPAVTNTASTGLTAGGWAAGFVLGLGLMALLGGLGLFIATARSMRRFSEGTLPEQQL